MTRPIIHNKKHSYWFLMIVFISGLLSGHLLLAEETLVTIANNSNYRYAKPEVKISPSGDIYVVYEAKNDTTGQSEIFLSKYTPSGEVEFVKNISESSTFSYEPEIDIRSNGDIHIAWCEQTSETHAIKYRYYNGSSWSRIYHFGQVENSTNIEDLRIAVDPSGNVFVVFMYWPQALCIIASKYGEDIYFEDFPEGGRLKHADVAVDNNYIHVVWQYRAIGSDIYTIGYQRRPNRPNAEWDDWIDVGLDATQRPRLSLDNSGNPHVVFFENFGTTRTLWYRRGNGSSFTTPQVMSSTEDVETLHFCDVVAINAENVLVSMQRGGWEGGLNVAYNWKQNGQWSGYSAFSKTFGLSPTKQSIDLVADRFFAACAFAEGDEAVYLLLIEESGNPIGTAPIANFTYSPQSGNVPLVVTLDASLSSDPGGQITAYNWNFGDGTTGTGRVTTHTYRAEGKYTITLTVTDNEGKTGTISHVVEAIQPNIPPTASFTFTPQSGIYPLTVQFDASASTDSDGTITQYEWDFGGEEIGHGRTISHTFTDEGVKQVILTVYDNDGDSSSASGTVQVLGLFPPLNIAYEALTNRNLFTLQHIYKITWNHNPSNALLGANIIQYNIYRKRPAENYYTYLASVATADGNQYIDRLGSLAEQYEYTVTAVDILGRESKIHIPSQRRQPNTNQVNKE